MVYLAGIVKLVTCQVKHLVEGLEDKNGHCEANFDPTTKLYAPK